MSWLFSKSSSSISIPASTPLEQQRIKQIKSLYDLNKNVKEVKRDQDYNVVVQIVGKTLNLNIHLPASFPNAKPIVRVSPHIKHPWVDQYMVVVGSMRLHDFHMHSNLGHIIQEIIKEFKKRPPQFINVSEFQMPPVAPGFSTSSTYIKSHDFVQSHGSSDKACNSKSQWGNQEIEPIMSKIKELSINEIEEITSNPAILLDYIRDMEIVTDIQNKRAKLIEENEKIARENLSYESVIEDLKGDLKFSFEDYNDHYNKFQEKMQRQHEAAQIYDIGNISTNLQITISQSEEISEKIAEDFLDGAVNLDQFVKDYMADRKLYHLRRAKQERIASVVPHLM